MSPRNANGRLRPFGLPLQEIYNTWLFPCKCNGWLNKTVRFYKKMPLSSIVQVLLRLSSLNWFVTGLVQFATTVFALRVESFSLLRIVVSAILLLVGVLSWVFAPFLSRLFTRGADEAASLEGVSLFSLYSTAFVGLGLWFALSNFAQVFNWIHFSITYGSKIQGMTQSGLGSFYNLSQAALTLLAGVVLVATAQIWARKLTKDSEAAAPDQAPPDGSLK
jgi:hypothetical protein